MPPPAVRQVDRFRDARRQVNPIATIQEIIDSRTPEMLMSQPQVECRTDRPEPFSGSAFPVAMVSFHFDDGRKSGRAGGYPAPVITD